MSELKKEHSESSFNPMFAIHDAAIQGDFEKIMHLYGTHDPHAISAIPNQTLEYPIYSALFLAIENTDEQKKIKSTIFQKMLPYSITLLTHQNSFGDTILHRIAKNGFEHLIDDIRLLDAYPTLCVTPNESGLYPIHVAILNGQVGVVKRLLESGRCNTLRDGDENLPLHAATQVGSLELVQICLEHYPEGINQCNKWQQTPLDLAHQHNTPEVQHHLRQNHGVQSSNCNTTEVYSRFKL